MPQLCLEIATWPVGVVRDTIMKCVPLLLAGKLTQDMIGALLSSTVFQLWHGGELSYIINRKSPTNFAKARDVGHSEEKQLTTIETNTIFILKLYY